VDRVLDRVSSLSIDIANHIHDNNLAQGDPLGDEVSGLGEGDEEGGNCHHKGGGGGGEVGGSDDGEAEDGRADGLHGGRDGMPAASQGVAQGGVGDYEDHCHVGECREGHLVV